MSGQSDLLESFKTLAAGVNSYQQATAIKSAQADIDAINADQKLNEFQKIKAHQAVADKAAAAVGMYGGDAARMQQARMALSPNIPDAQMSMMEATGKGTIAEAAKAIQEKAKAEADAKVKQEQDFKMKLQKLENDSKERIAANTKSATKAAIPPAILTKMTGLLDSYSNLQSLKEDYATDAGYSIGPLNQYNPDLIIGPKATTYRSRVMDFFNQYRKDITGASASIPELKGLLKSVPNEGDYGPNFLAKIDGQIKGVHRALGNRITIMKAQGRDVSGLEELYSSLPAPDAPPAQEPSSSAPSQTAASTTPGVIPGLKLIKKK